MNKLDAGQPKDRPLQIRTRWDSHLDRLREAFPFLPEPSKVNRGSDYSKNRIYASPDDFAKVMDGLARKIDYSNFKGYMDADEGFYHDGFAHSLHEIWSIVYHAFSNSLKKKSHG